MFLFHMIIVILVTSIVSFVLFFLSVEPLHLYVKETVAPVTTQSTTPSVPDTTVVLEGNSQKKSQLFVLEDNSTKDNFVICKLLVQTLT